MFTMKRVVLVCALSGTLAGCAETSTTPAPITIDPILTKYDHDGDGGGGCPSGQVAGTTGLCLPIPGQDDQPPGRGTQIPQPNGGGGQGGPGQGNPGGPGRS